MVVLAADSARIDVSKHGEEGMVVVEVVLDSSGPDEAAIYDQRSAVPQSIQSCLGSALGSVSWPLPTEQQSVHFPIVGGNR